MRRVILFGPTASRNEQRLSSYLRTRWEIQVFPDELDVAPLKRAANECDALVTLGWNRAMAGSDCRLRLIQALGAGVDTFDLSALPAGCTLCNVYEHEIPIAEYVIGSMVSLTLRLGHHDQQMRRGRWDGTGRRDGHPHQELFGKTLGLVGYGHIGREIALRARAFGLKVMAVRARPHLPMPDALRPDWIGGPEELRHLLSQSDYVVICCSLDVRTRHWLNARSLSWLRSSAYLINVARAEVIEEEALYAVLRERRIAGAALDVWYRYPDNGNQILLPSRYPFHELDNLLMTPHFSGWTEPMIERRWRAIAANLDAFAEGQPLQNVVFRQGTMKGTNKTRTPEKPRGREER